MRELQIGGIIEGEAKALGKPKRGDPRQGIGIGIDRDVEQCQIAEGGITEVAVDTPAADRNGQAVRDFEAPERRH